MISVSFANSQWSNVQGYVLSTAFSPVTGIGGEFYVTLFVRQDAATPLNGLAFNPKTVVSGQMQISGDGKSYSFNPVRLIRYWGGMSRRWRSAVMEFQGNFDPRASTITQVNLSNTAERKLEPIPDLATQYQLGLDSEAPEHLLGMGNVLAANGVQIYRWVTLRNSANAWLPRVIAWDAAIRGGQPSPKSIDVAFSQSPSQPLRIDQITTHRLYVAEVFGACNDWPIFPTSRLVGAATANLGARVAPPDEQLSALLEHDNLSPATAPELDHHSTVELAVPLFNNGHYNSLVLQ